MQEHLIVLANCKKLEHLIVLYPHSKELNLTFSIIPATCKYLNLMIFGGIYADSLNSAKVSIRDNRARRGQEARCGWISQVFGNPHLVP